MVSVGVPWWWAVYVRYRRQPAGRPLGPLPGSWPSPIIASRSVGRFDLVVLLPSSSVIETFVHVSPGFSLNLTQFFPSIKLLFQILSDTDDIPHKSTVHECKMVVNAIKYGGSDARICSPCGGGGAEVHRRKAALPGCVPFSSLSPFCQRTWRRRTRPHDGWINNHKDV
jgi:hypothetical protein